MADEAFDETYEIINNEEGWKDEKKNEHGDICQSKKSRKGKKIYRIKAVINCDAKKLANALADTTNLTSWNTTITKHEHIKVMKVSSINR